jgi:hypothetical protein
MIDLTNTSGTTCTLYGYPNRTQACAKHAIKILSVGVVLPGLGSSNG